MIRTKAGQLVGNQPIIEPFFLRRRDVERMTGLSRSTMYALIARGAFPQPVPIGPRAVGWVTADVADWARECVARRDGKREAA
jgi:prophage regulatory protein